MINQIRNNVFTKVFWGLMGLYLLNISIDTADPHPEHIPEDLNINDQESIVEIIVEQILGFEDVFKEFDDYDPEDHNKKTNIKIDLITRYTIDYNNRELLFQSTKQKFPFFNACITNGFHQLDTPPPKV